MSVVTALPANAQKYSETPLFTEKTVPAKLTRKHNTKTGVWGRIVIESGSLRYVLCDDASTQQTLDENQPGIIRPQEFHFVEIFEPVTFKVEFFREAT